jgi:hypothetical protein
MRPAISNPQLYRPELQGHLDLTRFAVVVTPSTASTPSTFL